MTLKFNNFCYHLPLVFVTSCSSRVFKTSPCFL